MPSEALWRYALSQVSSGLNPFNVFFAASSTPDPGVAAYAHRTIHIRDGQIADGDLAAPNAAEDESASKPNGDGELFSKSAAPRETAGGLARGAMAYAERAE